MMRSRSNSSRGLGEMIRDNPFLCAAFLSGLALAALESSVGSREILQGIWSVLGFGFHLTAGWAQNMVPGTTGWLATAMSIALGLIPYLLGDVVWRHLRDR